MQRFAQRFFKIMLLGDLRISLPFNFFEDKQIHLAFKVTNLRVDRELIVIDHCEDCI